jgi:hypothetical protein
VKSALMRNEVRIILLSRNHKVTSSKLSPMTVLPGAGIMVRD